MNQTMQHSPEARAVAFSSAGSLQLLPFPWSENVKYLLARCERQIIRHAMDHAGGVKRQAAALLGISPFALERRIQRVARVLDELTMKAPSSFDQPRSSIPNGE